MNTTPYVSILVAEDNDISRQLMTSILEAKGYRVYGAIDGESAIKVIEDHTVHLALVDINMAPTGGFEFAKYLLTEGIDLPVIMITADDSADLLTRASALGVAQLFQKPVDPARLSKTVQRILSRRGLNVAPLVVDGHDRRHSAEDLMRKTINMAAVNVKLGKGRAFAALVADQDGMILGEGTNRHTSRYDPIAHAEVMAIRQAAEKSDSTDLSECTLYCSSMPTKIGAALIESVGIARVYYGLSHEDTGMHEAAKPPSYEQLCKDEALEMFTQSRK